MNTAKELTDNLIKRAKAMQCFKVQRQLDDSDIIFSAGCAVLYFHDSTGCVVWICESMPTPQGDEYAHVLT